MLQLNGTALPSLALENLQEIESLKLSRSDRDEAEKTIAEGLASLYAGQSRSTALRVSLKSFSSTAGSDTVSAWANALTLVHEWESQHHKPDGFCPNDVLRGDVALP